MLKIEIFQENVQTETRTIPAKDGKPSRTIYEQIAYAHLGGKFPVEMIPIWKINWSGLSIFLSTFG